MKWKDTAEGDRENPEGSNPYYEDDGYPSLKDKNAKKNTFFSGIPLRYIFWGLGIAVVIFFVLELGSMVNEQADQARIDTLERKIAALEEKLQKVDGVDEKVTRIWEQAKSFETFKTRFDRSEASMSLRMDHLAMSLDALQKKSNETVQQIRKIEKTAIHQPVAKVRKTVKKQAAAHTHTVVKGDTLYSISRKYGLSLDTLRAINTLKEKDAIHVGQVLVVSGDGH